MTILLPTTVPMADAAIAALDPSRVPSSFDHLA
jgi:hypothetical protein